MGLPAEQKGPASIGSLLDILLFPSSFLNDYGMGSASFLEPQATDEGSFLVVIDYVLKGRVIDAISDSSIENGLVAVTGNRISYVGDAQDYSIPNNCTVIEGTGCTIMPGFIDCHAHLFGTEDAGSFGNGKMWGDQLLGAAYQCGLLLDAGFTSVRDMSENGLYLSRAVDRGILRGPRIFPGGKILGITSGHVDNAPEVT